MRGVGRSAKGARFASERQALALMNHPNIAKVFDAGATETGRPYFAGRDPSRRGALDLSGVAVPYAEESDGTIHEDHPRG